MADLATLIDLRDRLANAEDKQFERIGVELLTTIGGWEQKDGEGASELRDERGMLQTRLLYPLPPHGFPSPRYNLNPTLSIGAAVALCERVLPGWVWGISQNCCALLYRRAENADGYNLKVSPPKGATPPLALCCAIIDALIAKEQAD
jgi:hypothetical protein